MKIQVNIKLNLINRDWFENEELKTMQNQNVRYGSIVDYETMIEQLYFEKITRFNNKMIEDADILRKARYGISTGENEFKHIKVDKIKNKQYRQYHTAVNYYEIAVYNPDRKLIVRFGDASLRKALEDLVMTNAEHLNSALMIGLDNYVRDFNSRNPKMIATDYVIGIDEIGAYLMVRILPSRVDHDKPVHVNPLFYALQEQFQHKKLHDCKRKFFAQEQVSVLEHINTFFNSHVEVPNKYLFS